MNKHNGLVLANILVYTAVLIVAVIIAVVPINRPSSTALAMAQGSAKVTPVPTEEPIQLETVELGSGNYVAGSDFPAGKYNVVAVSGTGSVSSSGMEINAMMGVVDPEDFTAKYYESEYKNITFAEGVTLKVKDVQIKLVPVS
jgi:hypothetical protein